MSSSVDKIKSKIDIVSLVSSYIQLEKAGGNFKGKCPFHNEKTPSFFVSPDRNSYYCFGCHAKGDIFTFVQEFEGLDFIGALKMLADKAGVTLENQESGNKTEKEKLFSVLEQATFFFQKKLSENEQARKYIESRGIAVETIKNFRIGFAPSEWRELYEYLKSKGVSEKEMLAVGLIKKAHDKPNTYYDTFRGRIMFPIGDTASRIVAFSGRALMSDEKTPKYLNSPETELFNKSEVLFGLDKAKREIRIKDYSILVEGQMDLVMMHQVGLTNTVASSGTALTIDHLTKLKRLSNKIVMAYDGDSAGFAASDRGAKLALSLGMELKVTDLPVGKDPADVAKEDPEKLSEYIEDSKHIIDFYTDTLLSRKLSGHELGKEIKNHVLPYVALLTSSIEKAHFIKTIARKTFIKEEALWDDLKNIAVPSIELKTERQASSKISRINFLERQIAGLHFWSETLNNINEKSKIQLEKIKKKAKEIMPERYDSLLKTYEKERDALIFETESRYTISYNENDKDKDKDKDKSDPNLINLAKETDELILSLEEELLKEKFTNAMLELQKSEQLRDSGSVLKYLEECQKISGQINMIKQIRLHNETSRK
jgi:DNA primase